MASLCTEPPGFLSDTKEGPGDTSASSRELSIQVTGTPPPNVTWLHNNEPIDEASNSRLSASYEEDGNMKATLSINEVKADDRGTYTLRASNMYGLAEEVWRVPVICKGMTLVTLLLSLSPLLCLSHSLLS